MIGKPPTRTTTTTKNYNNNIINKYISPCLLHKCKAKNHINHTFFTYFDYIIFL